MVKTDIGCAFHLQALRRPALRGCRVLLNEVGNYHLSRVAARQ